MFDGELDTPSRTLSVCTCLEDVFLQEEARGDTTRVQVWTNDPSEPDRVSILIVEQRGLSATRERDGNTQA